MAQFSVKIMRLNGSVLGEKQQRCWQTAKKYLIWFISTATVSVTFRHEVHHSTCLSKNSSSGLVSEALGMRKGCIETNHDDLSIRRRP